MSDRWVNAVIEVVVALDVPVEAKAKEKLDAAEEVMERVFRGPPPADSAVALSWEDVEDGERDTS